MPVRDPTVPVARLGRAATKCTVCRAGRGPLGRTHGPAAPLLCNAAIPFSARQAAPCCCSAPHLRTFPLWNWTSRWSPCAPPPFSAHAHRRIVLSPLRCTPVVWTQGAPPRFLTLHRPQAGNVRPVMITGDSVQCGIFIAQEVGMVPEGVNLYLGDFVSKLGTVVWSPAGGDLRLKSTDSDPPHADALTTDELLAQVRRAGLLLKDALGLLVKFVLPWRPRGAPTPTPHPPPRSAATTCAPAAPSWPSLGRRSRF